MLQKVCKIFHAQGNSNNNFNIQPGVAVKENNMQFTGTITNREPLFQRSSSMHLLHIRESKTVFDSGFHAMDSRFQVLDSSLFHRKLDSGLWTLDSGFHTLWDSSFRALDSRAQDSRFHKQNFHGFSNMGRIQSQYILITC